MTTLHINLNDGGRSLSKRVKQKNDCTVICTAIAFNMSYDDAYDFMQIHGRACNHGIHYNTFLKQYPQYVELYSTPYHGTVESVIPGLGKGRYIVLVHRHVFVVNDGVIQDRNPVKYWDSVFSVWEVKCDITVSDAMLADLI